MKNLDEKVYNNLDKIVKFATFVCSLSEFTH